MIVKPRMRGFICTTAHPTGLREQVLRQIQYVQQHGAVGDAQRPVGNVLVVGCSAGYGLASRISAAFGAEAIPLTMVIGKQPCLRLGRGGGGPLVPDPRGRRLLR